MAPPSDKCQNYVACLKAQSLPKKTLQTASKSFELCTPRTHGAPDSERDKKKQQLETKASPPEGQCIPAGCRVTLPRRVFITMSIITMRSRLFPANSPSDCLRFLKFRPQFCEFCGAIYRPTCETFSALQSTSGSVTDVENVFKSMHNWRRYASSNWYEIEQKTRF